MATDDRDPTRGTFDRPTPGMDTVAALFQAWQRLNQPSDPLSRATSGLTARLPTTPLPQQVAPGGPQFRPNVSPQDIARLLLPQTSLESILAMTPLPLGVKGGKKVVKEGMESAAEAAGRITAQDYIRAYHGSPHRFSRFSAEKIGAGQGAQSFGHGLYFAENPKVAQTYSDMLGEVEIKGLTPEELSIVPGHLKADAYSGSLTKKKLDELIAQYSESEDIVRHRLVPVLKKLRSMGNIEAKRAGGVYEVKIKAKPDEFLDWDKPLSEQSPKVRAALEKIGVPDSLRDGQEVTRWLAQAAPRWQRDKVMPQLKGSGDEMASQVLREAGIPGIRYLDEGSRALNGNFVLMRSGQPIREEGNVLRYLTRKEAERDLSLYKGAEIVESPQTHNIVLFDDSLVETITINGEPIPKDLALAILALGGGGVAAQQGGQK